MPRRNSAVKKPVLPDPIFGSKTVTKLVNKVMESGKKGLAQRIVYGAFDIIKEKAGLEGVEVFNQALENVKPVLEVKARRVGGGTYQVPIEVRPARRQALALRWLVNATRNRSEKGTSTRLAAELMDAYNQSGGAFKKKEEVHRMAEANKAFASYRW